jgi:outer membrane protein assembly factor BamB
MFRIATMSLLPIAFVTLTAWSADLSDDLLAAAKKGDADAVKLLLARGADVNAKSEYGVTALAFAADKGHLEVIKVLLEKKADINAKDTFYKAAPLDWAVNKGHAEIVKTLVAAGAAGVDTALQSAAIQGKAEVVRAILDKGKLKEATLNKALAATPAQHAAVADLLKKAGAKPSAPATEVVVDKEILAAYAGTYRNENQELKIVFKDGKLSAQSGAGPVLMLVAIDKVSFKAAGTATVTFRREGEKVTSLSLKVEKTDLVYQRVDPTKEPMPAKVAVEDKGGVVKTPLNWPSFRGANAAGIADGQFPPLSWNAAKNENIRWKTPIPGLGHSCPIVWGDRIYVTTAVSADGKSDFRPGLYGDVDSAKDSAVHTWRLFCLDKGSGKILWEKTACQGVPKVKRHIKASHANPTPVTDGKYVIASFGSEGLYCYDQGGKLIWEKSLGVLDSGWFYNAEYQWGFGSSPIIYKDLVIVQCDVGKGSFLAAFKIANGKEVWRKEREEIPSWGTPTIVEGPERVELVTKATKYARGYDPLTGAELWRLGRHAEITVPTPIFGAGLIFITSGYRPVQPIYAVRPGATGDITLKDGTTTNDAVAWSTAKGGPYMPTPIVYGDYLYICANAGIVTCHEAKTGKQVYKERLGGQGGYTASPVAADGKIYFTSEESGIRVVQAGPKFELLSVNLLDDLCMSTPAISDGMIFIRTQHYLFGIGRKTAAK